MKIFENYVNILLIIYIYNRYISYNYIKEIPNSILKLTSLKLL